MKSAGFFRRLTRRQIPASPAVRFFEYSYNLHQAKPMCTFSEEPELKEFTDFVDNLKNYEKAGVPKGAGTESDDGFDLGRMRRLMQLLGNPHCNFKAVHVAGTKGKGSTAAFLSSILRAQGYSVGCYTSPHIQTIRERITLGVSGDPVPAKTLNHHFQSLRMVLEKAIQLENGCLSHFEVLTAVAYSLFARKNVDIAVIEAGLGGARDATNVIPSSALAAAIITSIGEEHLDALGGSLESIAVAKSGIVKYGRPLVLGGPFLPHIEHILREKASCMSSPVVSASDDGNKSTFKSIDRMSGRPFQYCDLVLHIGKDLQLFIELFNVKLSMLGHHQLKNAATATCAALCLRSQGWELSDESIHAGLESAFLIGRNQILTQNETEKLGLSGATIMVDGAHTKESARALVNTIEMAFSNARIVLVVAMASDKDHLGFAKELLSARRLEAVFFTEASIAGDKSRTTSASSLRGSWVQASREMGIDVRDYMNEAQAVKDLLHPNRADRSECRPMLFGEGSLMACMEVGGSILGAGSGGPTRVIVVTGSLHVVSALLGYLLG